MYSSLKCTSWHSSWIMYYFFTEKTYQAFLVAATPTRAAQPWIWMWAWMGSLQASLHGVGVSASLFYPIYGYEATLSDRPPS